MDVVIDKAEEFDRLCRHKSDELLLRCVVPQGYDAYRWYADYAQARRSGFLTEAEGLLECADLDALKYHYTGRGENLFCDESSEDAEEGEEVDARDREVEKEDGLLHYVMKRAEDRSCIIIIKFTVSYGVDVYHLVRSFNQARNKGYFHPQAILTDLPDLRSIIIGD